MIAMDKVHSIRQLFYEQGKSVSAIAAETGHDRKTICKYLDMTDFNTPEPKKEDPENMCPKLDSYKPLIDQWLLDDRKAPRKQRHTAKRVFKRLQAETEDFDCSYRLVAQYVAYSVYYDENVPLFRRNGYRKSGTMILRVRSRDTALN